MAKGKHSNHLCGVCGGKVTSKKGRCYSCKMIPTTFKDKDAKSPTPQDKIDETLLKNATREQLLTYLKDNTDYRDIKFCPECNPRPKRQRNDITVPVWNIEMLERKTLEEVNGYLNTKYAIQIPFLKRVLAVHEARQLNHRFHPEEA